jgi:hypothetical protein
MRARRPYARDRRAIALVAVGLVAAAFYAWTAATSARIAPGHRLVDPYNALTDALLDGHVALEVRPPAGLVGLRNPYDPARSQPYRDPRLPDLSLYHGRYYAYWGPTPVLVLFAPFRALGLGRLPPGLATLLLCLALLAVSLALLRWLQRRLAPAAATWKVAVAALALAVCDLAPYLLRSPQVYEAAIAAGQVFLLLGALLALSGTLRATPSARLLAAASLCFGLAVGARPQLGLAGLLLVVAGFALRRRGTLDRRLVAALAAPFVACVALLAAYNAARFGSPLEFGQRWQVAGFDQHRGTFLRPGYLPPNLWSYLVVPAAWRLQFPYFWLPPPPAFPGHLPASYWVDDTTGGLLPDLPVVVLLGLLGVAFAGAARRVLLAGAALGALLMLFVALYANSAAERYEADFVALLLVPALLVWLELPRRLRTRRARRLANAGGAVLVAYGIVVALAVSLVGKANALHARHPAVWHALEDAFSPVPTVAVQLAGGPRLAAVDDDPRYPPGRLDQLGIDGTTFTLGLTGRGLQVVAPGPGRALLVARASVTPLAPAGTQLALRVSANGHTTLGPRVAGQLLELPLRLRRGLNQVRVRAVTPTINLAPGDYRRGSLVELSDVRVRSAT